MVSQTTFKYNTVNLSCCWNGGEFSPLVSQQRDSETSEKHIFFSGTSFTVLFCRLLLRLPSSGPTYLKLVGMYHLTSMHFAIDSNPHLVAPFLTCYFLNVLLRKVFFPITQPSLKRQKSSEQYRWA